MSDPRSIAATAVYELVTTGKGTKLPYPEVGSPAALQGSQNQAWNEAIASEDWTYLQDYAAYEHASGWRRIEAGAELYDPDVLVARATALHLAPAEHPVRPLLISGLAASIAYYSIGALLGGRTSAKLITAGPTTSNVPKAQPITQTSLIAGDAHYYTGGISICTPGHRFNPAVMDGGTLGPLVAWALGYTATFKRTLLPIDVESNYWPVTIAQAVLGIPYGKPTPASSWGITDADRTALRALIEQNSSAGLDHAIGMLAGWGLYGPLMFEVIGAPGWRQARLNQGVNSMKPQLAVAQNKAGVYTAIVPSPFLRLDAPIATTTDSGSAYTATAPGGITSTLAYPGKPSWRFQWDKSGARRAA